RRLVLPPPRSAARCVATWPATTPRTHPTMEDRVPRQNYRKILSVLLPAGALGMSILLGSAGAQAAPETALDPQAGAASPRVGERLAAIRDAVSEVTLPGAQAPAAAGTE